MLHAMCRMLRASCQVGQTDFSVGVDATRNVGTPQENSNKPLNSLQPPPPGLGTLQLGVPQQVSRIRSPQGLMNSSIHEQ